LQNPLYTLGFEIVVSKGAKQGPSGSGVTEQVVVALRRIIRAIDLHSRFLVIRYGLTGPQLVVLNELSRRSGMSVTELTHAVHLSQATVTGILDRLEKRALVWRQRSGEDKRRVLVWLAQAGRTILCQAPPLLQENFSLELSKLEDWEQTQILSSLQRVVSMMEAKHLEAGPMLTAGPIEPSPEHARAFLRRKPPSTPPGRSPLDAVEPPGSPEAGR